MSQSDFLSGKKISPPPIGPGALAAQLERLRPAEILVPDGAPEGFPINAAAPVRRLPDWHFDRDAAACERISADAWSRRAWTYRMCERIVRPFHFML